MDNEVIVLAIEKIIKRYVNMRDAAIESESWLRAGELQAHISGLQQALAIIVLAKGGENV